MEKKNRVTISPLDLWKELKNPSRCVIGIVLCFIVNSFITYLTRDITLYNANNEALQPVAQTILRFCFAMLIEVAIAIVAYITYTLIADFRASYASAINRKARHIVAAAIADMISTEDNCSKLNIPFKEYTVDKVYKTYVLLYDNDGVCYSIKVDTYKDLIDFGKN